MPVTPNADVVGHYGGALMVTAMEIERIKRLDLAPRQAALELLDELVAAGYVIELAPDPPPHRYEP